jgi:membrane protein
MNRLRRILGNRVFRLLKTTFNDWMEDRALRLSAALAFYSVFSIAPLMVIAMGVASLVLGEEAVRGHLDDQLRAYVGPKTAEAVQSMVKGISEPRQGWTGTIVGFLTLLIGAGGVFGQLKDALNTIWEVQPKGSNTFVQWVRERVSGFGMVLVIGFLLLTSLILNIALAASTSYLERLIGLPPTVGGVLGLITSVVMETLLFAFIFKVLPDARVKWAHVWIGAGVTALLFELGKFGLSLYLGRESTTSGFGAAGSVVLVLLWVYYASCILFFGAEFTQVYSRDCEGRHVKPAPNAVPVTKEARAQQGMVPAEVVERSKAAK